jgi:hypothetical protein
MNVMPAGRRSTRVSQQAANEESLNRRLHGHSDQRGRSLSRQPFQPVAL